MLMCNLYGPVRVYIQYSRVCMCMRASISHHIFIHTHTHIHLYMFFHSLSFLVHKNVRLSKILINKLALKSTRMK